MIVPMQRVTVLCAAADRDEALRRLYELGVVHLQSGSEAADGDLESAARRVERLRLAIGVLTRAPAPAGAAAPAAGIDAEAVLRLDGERSELLRELTALEQERLAVLPFGDFDPTAFDRLQQAGVTVELFHHPAATRLALPAGATLQILSEQDGMTAAAVVGAGGQDLGVRPVPVPARGLQAVEAAIAAATQRASAIERELQQAAASLSSLQRALAVATERHELLAARAQMGGEAGVAWITGFCPEPQLPALRDLAARHAMVVTARAVTPDDGAPTLLGGPRWVRQVHAVFEGIGIVPGYAEADVSALFLIFLMLFAAMLIGDAGYGALLLGIGLLLWKKTRRAPGGPPQAVRLLLTTSLATIGWGAMTGTWFAIGSLPATLDLLRIEWLAGSDKVATSKHVMLFCFLLGAIHISVAHLWAALRCGKSLQALAQLGWIASTWLMFALANTMVLGEAFPSAMTTVAIVGVALIVLFMTPPKQLKHEWFNHVMLPLSLVSNFVDVVSYLRLFAVGTAGVAVASSFNDMAARAAAGGGTGWLLAAGIAMFGHTLNLLLCAMGVLVHGVRLNTLEFSAHLGLQWSGVPYRPFGGRREPAADGAQSQDS